MGAHRQSVFLDSGRFVDDSSLPSLRPTEVFGFQLDSGRGIYSSDNNRVQQGSSKINTSAPKADKSIC